MTLYLSEDDIRALEAVVATEVGSNWSGKTLDDGVAAIVDTVLNRVEHPAYPDTISDVVNQRKQFSAINGPVKDAWGSWQNVPDSVVNRNGGKVREAVQKALQERATNVPSIVGGHLNYANPSPLYSGRNAEPGKNGKPNGWVYDLAQDPYLTVGSGLQQHVHGTASWANPLANGPQVSLMPSMENLKPGIDDLALYTSPPALDALAPAMPTPKGGAAPVNGMRDTILQEMVSPRGTQPGPTSRAVVTGSGSPVAVGPAVSPAGTMAEPAGSAPLTDVVRGQDLGPLANPYENVRASASAYSPAPDLKQHSASVSVDLSEYGTPVQPSSGPAARNGPRGGRAAADLSVGPLSDRNYFDQVPKTVQEMWTGAPANTFLKDGPIERALARDPYSASAITPKSGPTSRAVVTGSGSRYAAPAGSSIASAGSMVSPTGSAPRADVVKGPDLGNLIGPSTSTPSKSSPRAPSNDFSWAGTPLDSISATPSKSFTDFGLSSVDLTAPASFDQPTSINKQVAKQAVQTPTVQTAPAVSPAAKTAAVPMPEVQLPNVDSPIVNGIPTPTAKPELPAKENKIGKNVGRAVGALAGGALLGPLGAIAGTYIGGRIGQRGISMPKFNMNLGPFVSPEGFAQTPMGMASQAATQGGGFDSAAYWSTYANSGGGSGSADMARAQANEQRERAAAGEKTVGDAFGW